MLEKTRHAVTIRPALEREADELSQLCWLASKQAQGDASRVTISAASIARGLVLVAEDENGTAIGVTAVVEAGFPNLCQLAALHVSPHHWRRGVGRALFQAAAQLARTMDAGALSIFSEPGSGGFYLRLGALRIGQIEWQPGAILPHLLFPL
jgi:predicted N-acetyltransferase YhbS